MVLGTFSLICLLDVNIEVSLSHTVYTSAVQRRDPHGQTFEKHQSTQVREYHQVYRGAVSQGLRPGSTLNFNS